jgi:hypothetical protein
MVREPGRNDGEVWDPKLNDKRTEIEIHGGRRMARTQGCFGINEPGPVYEQFKSQLRYLIAWLGTVSFEVRENPEGEPAAVAAYAPLTPPRYPERTQVYNRNNYKETQYKHRRRR